MAQITLTESKKEKLAQKYIDYICKRHGLDQESRAAQLIYFAYMHGINNCLDELRKENVVLKDTIEGNVLANGMGEPILHLWDKGKHLVGKKVKVVVIEED